MFDMDFGISDKLKCGDFNRLIIITSVAESTLAGQGKTPGYPNEPHALFSGLQTMETALCLATETLSLEG